ncbi:MAG TPA: hypothetical protein ENL46_08005, partial [Candidatus Aminicenantes bacterium]|nr:hypothetical protein [Candidatus Aminicenantes bacterium]
MSGYLKSSSDPWRKKSDPLFKTVIDLMARGFDLKRDLSPVLVAMMRIETFSCFVSMEQIKAYG